MDILYINGLKVETSVGVHAWEHQIKQQLVLDLEIGLPAVVDDDLSKTYDYDLLSSHIREFASTQHFKLIETFAHCVADSLVSEFKMSSLKLKVVKPGALAGAREVGVVVTKSM